MESNRNEILIIFGSIFLIILNLIDGGLTLWGLRQGVIEEVNPLMLLLIEKSPIVFMIVKLLLPVMLGLVFWWIRNRSCRLVRYGLGLVSIVYVLVMVFHVYWITNS